MPATTRISAMISGAVPLAPSTAQARRLVALCPRERPSSVPSARTRRSSTFEAPGPIASVTSRQRPNGSVSDWRASVGSKLESLAAIDQTVRESLVFSWRRVLDMVQLAGWAILLVGYFVLFIVNNR